jgi:hypothetical protein
MELVLSEVWIITNYPVFRAAYHMPLNGESYSAQRATIT